MVTSYKNMASAVKFSNVLNKFMRIQANMRPNIVCELCGDFPKRTFAQNIQNSEQYCIDIVRKHDYEHFLCILLLSKKVRRAAFAIHAFNVEIAQIRDTVRDANLGKMRMHFWRDSLNHIYQGHPPMTPVCQELFMVVDKYALSQQWFSNIIDARTSVLNDFPFKDMADLEQYSESTVSSLNYLFLQTLGINNNEPCQLAASHLGKAQGIATVLRSTPYNASKGRVIHPVNLTMKYGASQNAIIRGKTTKRIRELVYDLATRVEHHLNCAQALRKDTPKKSRSLFLSSTITENYLASLQGVDFDVFHARIQQRNHFLPVQLWLRSWR